MPLVDKIRTFNGASLNWLVFFALVLGAWGALFWMAGGGDAPIICGAPTQAVPFSVILAMWALMSGAMMAPTFVPTLVTYRDLGHARATARGGFLALLAGYLVVWLGFSALAAGAQMGFARMDLVGQGGVSLSSWLNAALLAGAGLYQFSRLKNACLSQCRAPLTFFIGNWRPGVPGAAQMGLRLGVVCLGCCWALMALGFVGGTMNLWWMGLATLVMVGEKLPELGRYITRPLGLLLLSGAGYAALMALTV